MNTKPLTCRGCGRELRHLVVDLGSMPLANRLLAKHELSREEASFPLRVRFCDGCYLVQADDSVPPEEIFSDYPYFSSYSSQWLEHAQKFCHAAVKRFSLDSSSRVIEVASNDGYLLRNFVAAGIPCLGIEPAENVAIVARAAGVPTVALFLGTATAESVLADFGSADLVIANNVLAHTPNINDLTAGMAALLKPGGSVLCVEFPHLLRLIAETQFDTIYHEHFSYLSLAAIEKLFARHGMRVFDVERLSTHGGSLRIYAERVERSTYPEHGRVAALRAEESRAGIQDPRYYADFGARVDATVQATRRFLAEAAASGKTVAGYGAAAKGNTLLNACHASPREIAFVADRNPHKQGRYLPGTHIPILAPERIAETRPDYLFILPWNLKQEILQQLAFARSWGGRFVTAIPKLELSS